MSEAAFNRTQPDDDIGMRAQCFRRFTSVLIGQGIDADVGKVGLDIAGDGIDKIEQGSGGAAFPIVQRFTGIAHAPFQNVVLRNADDGGLRMVLDPLANGCDGQLAQVGIGKAALHVAIDAFAIDEREIFRVLFEKLPRNEVVETVNEGMINRKPAAVFIGQFVMLSI